MNKHKSCLLKHMGKSSPINPYRAEMAEDVAELVADGKEADAAWLEVIDDKLGELQTERARIEADMAQAYAKARPAAKVKKAAPEKPAEAARQAVDEQVAAVRVMMGADAPAKAKPLYASRPVVNAQAIIDWAASQGFTSTLPASDLHVTVAYSSAPMDGKAVPAGAPGVSILGGKRTVEPLGDEGAVVLKFTSAEMSNRWQAYRDAGASWDYEGYTPHVTITYDGKGVDLSKVQPYTGPIELGAETQGPLDSGVEVKEVPAVAPAMHKDPGEPAEVVTPAVVKEAIATAAKAEGKTRSQMKAEALALIDAAIAAAPKTGLKKITIKVPGDGTFTVVNNVKRLTEFRKDVERSPGFRDKLPTFPIGKANSSPDYGPDQLAREMLDDGEPLNAVEALEAAGKTMMFGNSGGERPIPYTNGEAVQIEDISDLFVGRGWSTKKGNTSWWSVVHKPSGFGLGGSADTKAEAIAEAKKLLAQPEKRAKMEAIIASGKAADGQPFKTQDELRAEFMAWAEKHQQATFDSADAVTARAKAMNDKEKAHDAFYQSIMGGDMRRPARADWTPAAVTEFLAAAEKAGKVDEALKFADDVVSNYASESVTKWRTAYERRTKPTDTGWQRGFQAPGGYQRIRRDVTQPDGTTYRAELDERAGAFVTGMVQKWDTENGAPRTVMTFSNEMDARQRADKFLDGIYEGKAKASTLAATPSAAPAAAEPVSKTPMVDAHQALFKAVRNGGATPEDFKAIYAQVRDGKAAILAELNLSTKDQLLKDVSGYVRPGTTKTEIMEAIYKGLLNRFALGKDYGPNSYMMGQEKAYEKAKRDAFDALVDGQTAESLAQYAAELKAEFDAAMAKRAERLESIKDPKTLDDFRAFTTYHMREGKTEREVRFMLTPEQRARVDDLYATETRSKRTTAKDEQRTTVRVAGQTVDGDIIATKHTKKGTDLFVVRLAERVSREDYDTLNAGAKRIGGYYSSFRGAGAIPGFQFTTREQAQAFVTLAGGDNTAAVEAAKERRDAFQDDRSQSAVERLTEMADRLEERADESLGRERKANTERRARFAASAEAAAQSDKALAKTMRNIAGAITAGTAKFLDRVRQKAQVELLQTYVRSAKDAEIRAQSESYVDQERRKGEPPTATTADYAEFPTFTAYRSDLASLGRQLQEVDGTKKMGDQLMKVADDVSDAFTAWAKEPGNLFKLSTFSVRAGEDVRTAIFKDRETAERAIKRSGLVGKAIVFPEKRGVNRIIMSPSEAIAKGIWKGDGDKRITLDADFGAELVEKIGRANRRGAKVSVPWQFENAYDRRKALARMGIETSPEFRAALREFIGLREQAKAPDKVKEMERAMIGRRNDGLDFFPTPEDTADAMVAAADIQPGMRVLEPSAGMGHIAERIREASEIDPEVAEVSSARRALLEAKGFNVVGSDFLALTEGGYDRILMNPPFSEGRDIQHVRHAYDLLKPGGRLVALMGESAFTNQNKRATEFREWLESVGGTEEKLAEGTFNDPSLPVNTGANARMVVIEKGNAEDAKFSRAPQTYGIPMRDAEAVATTVRAMFPKAPPIFVHHEVANAPAEIKRQVYEAGAENDAEAVYVGGEIHAFANNLESIERALFVIGRHEVRHAGFAAMFGDPRLKNQALLGIALKNPALMAEAKQRMADGREANRSAAIEETLADMPVDRLLALSGIDRLIAKVRQWLRDAAATLRKKGYATLADAVDPKTWTDKDVAAFVMRAENISRVGGGVRVPSGGTMFSEQPNTEPWYSALARAVKTASMNAGPASAWKAMAKNWTTTGKAKADEIAWSGLDEWLDMQQGKVTKQAVVDYLDANGVRVTETVLGDSKNRAVRDEEAAIERMNAEYAQWQRTNGLDLGSADEHINDPALTAAQRAWLADYSERWDAMQEGLADYANAEDEVDATKYGRFTLPGGTAYREVLLTLPDYVGRSERDTEERIEGLRQQINEYEDQINASDADEDTDWISEELASARAELKAEREELGRIQKSRSGQYRSGHWDQPNILAHIRLNDRTDAEGKRVLFVEEIQSDWGQAGKKQGFALNITELPADVTVKPAASLSSANSIIRAAARKEYDRVVAAAEAAGVDSEESAAARLGDKGARLIELDMEVMTALHSRNTLPEEADFNEWRGLMRQIVPDAFENLSPFKSDQKGWGAFRNGQRIAWALTEAQARAGALDVLRNENTQRPPAAPFVGKTDAWVALALKRVIKMAVDGGYDRVAFVTGEQSAERYDLSKQITSLAVYRDGNGFKVSFTAINGGTQPARAVKDADELADTIGKDLAKKAIEDLGERRSMVNYSGLDLKVGGEGMKAFYDKIVPAVAKDVLRKVGGELGTVQLASDGKDWTVQFQDGSRGEPMTERQAREKEADDDGAKAVPVGGFTQPGFDITDAMKARASGGLPMFSRRDVAARPASTPVAQLNRVLRGAGWEVDYIDLDLTGAKPKADIRIKRDDGRFLVAKVDSIGRANFETFQRERNLRMDPKNPQSRLAPHIDDTFLGRQRFEGARSMLRGMVQYLTDNATSPVELADMRAAWAGVMAAPTAQTEALPAPAPVPEPGQLPLFSRRTPEQQARSAEKTAEAEKAKLGKALTTGSLRNARLPAGYVAADFLGKSLGRVHWWHRTVGTPYNVAMRQPQFKPVYDAIQTFLNDVSHYAAEAANLAPTILPKLESMRDIFKSPLGAADAKAVAAPVFEGTLGWARDEDGKPVKMEVLEARAEAMNADEKATLMLQRRMIDPRVLRMWQGLPLEQYEQAINTRYQNEALRPGVVWSDAELRSMFSLTDPQIGLYREFRAATDKSLDDLTVSAMLRVAGKDAQDLRDQVLALADINEAAEVLRDRMFEMAEADPDNADRLNKAGNDIIDIADRVQDLKDRGYAPLSRFGSLTLDVTTPDGERQYFGMFETDRERRRKAREMEANFPDAKIEMGTTSEEEFKQFAGVTPETLELFADVLGLTDDKAKDDLFQNYLRKAKANRSGLKRLIHRKGVPGFSEDIGRVLASFVYSNARQTSSNLHVGAAEQAIEDIGQKDGQLKDYAIRLNEYVKNPQEEAQALRSVLFAQFLGGSLASAMVNASQPFMVTFPYLSQYGGVYAAEKQMVKALADVGRNVFPKDKGLTKAMRDAIEDGIVAPQEVFFLQAQASGKGQLKTGDGTAMGWAGAATSNTVSRLALAWGKPFSYAELFNRRLTFIAAYRTAVDQGMPNPAQFARDTIAATQFTYNKGNRPQWARGAVGALLFTFKTYSVSMMELMSRSLKTPEGRRAALVMLAMIVLVAGVDGLPFMEDMEDVIDGFAQRVLDRNWSTKAERNRLIAMGLMAALGDKAGLVAADFVAKGLTGIPGSPIDVSGRLGLHNLIPGTGIFLKKQAYQRDVAELAGPAGSLAQRMFEAAGQALGGDPLKAAVTVAPIAVQNVAKAVEMERSGFYPDTKGAMVVKTTTADAVSKGFGFQPGVVKRTQDVTYEQSRLVGLAKQTEAEIVDAIAKGIVKQDEAAQKAGWERLARWNLKNPETPIKITPQQVLNKARNMTTEKTQRMLKTTPRELRPGVSEAFNREKALQE